MVVGVTTVGFAQMAPLWLGSFCCVCYYKMNQQTVEKKEPSENGLAKNDTWPNNQSTL
jgi:hypothetical protein